MVSQSSAEGLFYYTVYCITLNSKCVARIVSKNGIFYKIELRIKTMRDLSVIILNFVMRKLYPKVAY